MTKSERLRAYFTKYPHADSAAGAAKIGCDISLANRVRKELRESGKVSEIVHKPKPTTIGEVAYTVHLPVPVTIKMLDRLG